MLHEWFLYFLGALASLFSIVNPLLAAPVFVTLTETMAPIERAALAKRASLNVFAVLVAFFLTGSLILSFFGISLDALRIGGGLMILASAFGMLNKRERLLPEEKKEAKEKEDIAFSPLAMPLLSGPGAIAVIIGLTVDANSMLYYWTILLVIILVSLACYGTLILSQPLMGKLGKTLVKAFTRIMGFLLLCVGVQYVLNGIQGIALEIMKKAGVS